MTKKQPHVADGLYAFSLRMLDEKGLYACAYGRAQFMAAAARHMGETVTERTQVVITADFMRLLERYFDGACLWFARRMEELNTIPWSDMNDLHNVSSTAVVGEFMDVLYKRAQREGLISA